MSTACHVIRGKIICDKIAVIRSSTLKNPDSAT